MTVRSDVLVAYHSSASGAELQTIDTVPSGEVWLLKDISVNQVGASATRDMFLAVKRGSNYHWFLRAAVTDNNVVVSSSRFVVAESGDQIALYISGSATDISVLVGGARLVV